ncbi:unnamed protein product [Durusdinium trenchii]|uniref:Uncharacterized protein n=1 Tax=Durusdinium trenchii TaxID=1381693 RepID=A0ABP0P0V1_9DINO
MWPAVLVLLLRATFAIRAADETRDLHPRYHVPNVTADVASGVGEEEFTSVTRVDHCVGANLGDHLDVASRILLPICVAWLCISVVVAFILLLWRPSALTAEPEAIGSPHPETADAPEVTQNAGDSKTSKPEAISWPRVAFDSITSSLAGMVGFVGFQKIVVARVVALSDTCDLLSLENILLYITVALSVTAVVAIIMFLAVDYLRRLAIHAAQRKGYRLTMEPKELRQTGLGIVILLLALVMLLLYACVIIKESQGPEGQDDLDKFWVFVEIAAGGATLVIFYQNLRGLHRSPKMQFDSARHGDHKLNLQQFLNLETQEARDAPAPCSSFARALQWLAGEDLPLLAFKGTRRAFFPEQPWAPLTHAICGLLVFGVFPLILELCVERFFAFPDLVELKSTTGNIAEIGAMHGEVEIPSLELRTLLNPKPWPKKYVFLGADVPAKLQVRTSFHKTSKVRLCCGEHPCSEAILKHKLIKLFDQPVDVDVPHHLASNCTLSLLGFSSQAVTNVMVALKPKREHNFCDCSLVGCTCCDGYSGSVRFKSILKKLISPDNFRNLSGICVAASCDTIQHTNGQKGSDCGCADGFVGDVKWDGPVPTGACIWEPCAIENSTFRDGNCTCMDGFVGQITWESSKWSGWCRAAECKIPNSNRRPGKACKCKDGFLGSIDWDGGRPIDKCDPAPCDVNNSNQKPGPSCQCEAKFVGGITWNESTPVGTCEPASCEGDKLNGLPGRDCQCKDGYTGEPEKHHDILRDSGCQAAPCKIANSTGDGPGCKCKRGFEGVINWTGTVASGSCTPAGCDIPNSNKMPGPQCQCSEWYEGKIHWLEHGADGRCTPRACRGKLLNGVAGPGCACADGYTGHVRPIARKAHGRWPTLALDGECEPAPCNMKNSNNISGPECGCADGFIFNGSGPVWNGSVLQGSCEAAPCNIANSNRKPGAQCACAFGFEGDITWRLHHASGECRPLRCVGNNVNGVDGPGCGCKDGCVGTVHVKRQVNQTWDDWDEKLLSEVFYDALEGRCEPAPCDIENSNHESGQACRCRAGYYGAITWNGSMPDGRCKPAPCYIPNSNQESGLSCRCMDGYEGKISWSDDQPSGTCVATPCQVPNSDFAAGPGCRCLPGFYGQITWQGNTVEGECLPLPACAASVVHTTWLQAQLNTSKGHACHAGQQLIFFGHASTGARKIEWKFAHSQPSSKCKWMFSRPDEEEYDQYRGQEDGAWYEDDYFYDDHDSYAYDDVTQLYSEVVPALPMECSDQAPVARCNAKFHYIITSKRAFQYTCADGVETLQSTPEAVQFRAHQCGYDLIQWEAAVILKEPGPHPSLQIPTCGIKGQDGRASLQCGEVPDGELLPGGCLHMREPAVFKFEVHKDVDVEGKLVLDQWETWSQLYVVKFFDNGWSAIHSHDETVSSNWSTSFWWTDGKYFSMNLPGWTGSLEEGDFVGQRTEGGTYLGPSGQFRLRSVALPSWWASTFEGRAARANDINIDELAGCKLTHYQNGTCYQVVVSSTVHIFQSEEGACPRAWGRMEDAMEDAEDEFYKFAYSSFGTQTYENPTTHFGEVACSPFAMRRQLQLEIQEVHNGTLSGAVVVADMETPCRKVLRFVMDASRFLLCQHIMDEEWEALMNE